MQLLHARKMLALEIWRKSLLLVFLGENYFTKICAFCSSEFAGHILRFDGGKGFFLDVVWLSQVLSPILSHKLQSERPPPTAALCKSRDDLVNNGILHVDFARYLWKSVLDGSTVGSINRMLNGFYRVLLNLDVILPLGRTALSSNDGRISKVPFEDDSTPQDVLVVMRLPDTDSHISEERLHSRFVVPLESAREVMLHWRFDSAGAPQGLVERLIASCHVIGEVEIELCWRFGACFKSHAVEQQNGQVIRLYRFIIRYDVLNAPREGDGEERVLSLRMMGPLEDERVWIAIRYVASAVLIMSKEWPGVLWKGWSECPMHCTDVIYLATPREVIRGRIPTLFRFQHFFL